MTLSKRLRAAMEREPKFLPPVYIDHRLPIDDQNYYAFLNEGLFPVWVKENEDD